MPQPSEVAQILRQGGARAHSTLCSRIGASPEGGNVTILVGYASAHGSARGIAQQIGDRLMKAGFRVAARPLAEVETVTQYEALVLGSAIHDQAWLPQGSEFLTRHASELAKRPVWLFSVSSVSDTQSVFEPTITRLTRRLHHETRAAAAACRVIEPRDHRQFEGVIERGDWGRAGDLFLKLCGGYPGDRRDFRDVDDWAHDIARELQTRDHAQERRRLHLMVRGKP